MYQFLMVKLIKPQINSQKLRFFLWINNIRAPVCDLKSYKIAVYCLLSQ